MLNYLNSIGLNPMSLFLKAQGYPPAVVFSVVLHVAVIYMMLDHDFAPRDMVDLDKPIYVSAVAVNENPQRKMRVLNEQRVSEAQEEKAAREREQAEQRRIDEQQQQQEEKRQQELEDQAARDEAARRQRERDEQAEIDRLEKERLDEERRQRELAEAEERRRQEEVAREAQARRDAEIAVEQQATEADAVQAYVAIIHNAISDNWTRPPSARNGMTVVINLQLLPTGEIRDATIIQSSGDAAFDRAAEQAVRRADRFPELQEMPTRLFNSQFRNINLTFRPEDLLR